MGAVKRHDLPVLVHYGSLIVGAITIMLFGRDQWFIGDDWDIIVPRADPDMMQPHVGHWNVLPALAFHGIRNLLGIDSYLPFLALALVAHFVVAHLIWRILVRIGVHAWLAVMLAATVVFFGGGADNILWAFQFGFMGAIACGLAVVLLFDAASLRPMRVLLIVVLSVAAPMLSGSGLPVLAAAFIVGVVRVGWLRTVAVLAPAGLSYLAWYFSYGVHGGTASAPFHGLPTLISAVRYAVTMLVGGLGLAFPVVWLGIVPALAVIAWFFVTVWRGIRSRAAPAYALVIGALLFVLLTTYSRMALGIESAVARRYTYALFVELLPALGLMLGWLLARGPRWRIAVLSIALLFFAWNAALLGFTAISEGKRESAMKARADWLLVQVVADPSNPHLLAERPDPGLSSNLYGADLLTLYREGRISLP